MNPRHIAAAAVLLLAGGAGMSLVWSEDRGAASASSGRGAEGSASAVGARPADGPLEPARLDSMLARAERIRPLSSLLAWHRGELVAERYYRGARADEPTNLKSASKTLLSPLVGIAIRDSLIPDIDTTLRELLPAMYDRLDRTAAGEDRRRDSIRVRHLLDMSSGLETTSFHNYGEWVASSDWGWDQLRRPMECSPGSCYRYSTGATHLLGIALADAAGTDLRTWAGDVLFEPLGITPLPAWDRSPRGYYLGGNNMALRPRDLLKFGVLYLQGGRWEGRSLVPERWIERAWEPPRFRSPWNGMGYGGLWWRSNWAGEQVYSAWGYGGQFLVVVPRLDLAVVATSSLTRTERGHNRRMRRFFDREVIPAFQPVADRSSAR